MPTFDQLPLTVDRSESPGPRKPQGSKNSAVWKAKRANERARHELAKMLRDRERDKRKGKMGADVPPKAWPVDPIKADPGIKANVPPRPGVPVKPNPGIQANVPPRPGVPVGPTPPPRGAPPTPPPPPMTVRLPPPVGVPVRPRTDLRR